MYFSFISHKLVVLQMLLIAGTEPCSLQHSHPPRNLEKPSATTMSVRTIPRFSTRANRLNTGAQVSSTASSQQLPGKEATANPSISGLDKNKDALPKPPLSSSMSTEAVVSSGSSTSTSPIQPTSAAQRVQTKASELVQSRAQNTSGNSSQSGKLEDTVDFEKVYTFLSTVSKGDGEVSLTAMGKLGLLLILCIPCS